MSRAFGTRRAVWVDEPHGLVKPSPDAISAFERLDAIYRSLCAMLYNYAPMSGHPGGSISSGRFVSSLLFDAMEYDVSQPDRDDADVISYAAGHKALGLYAMWALRNEIMRIGAPELLPSVHDQLRLEDLLGFRRNPTHNTPWFRDFHARALDGHPTPATPFVKLSTGASGVGVASSFGLALAMADWFGIASAPRVHVVEGEGGLTPGRVAESLAFAATSGLRNIVMHLDWNQSSIDSDRVTRENGNPGDYVQWEPAELFYLHDWNVIPVADGSDFNQIAVAQQQALSLDNGQPTAIIYRTTKGWRYGIEGRSSHGAGHKLCTAGFYDSLSLPANAMTEIPRCDAGAMCGSGANHASVEHCFWDALQAIRRVLEEDKALTGFFARRLTDSRQRLAARKRAPRTDAPSASDAYTLAALSALPRELALKAGQSTTLRGQLGKTLGYINRYTGGSFFVAAADLLGSTSISEGATDFAPGFFHASSNADSRTLSVGGICEDAISGVLSGIGAFGKHIGAGASYGAFMAPLGHIAARLHAIADDARRARGGPQGNPMVLICGHAGLKTGEDGPTHADPQPLQLLQENFPPGAMITLTPWDPNEVWPLFSAALAKRPAVIAPFVTRPNERVIDREALGLAPVEDATKGVYRLRKAAGTPDVTVVLQESGVTYEFVTVALPLLLQAGIDVEAYYVASAELFTGELPADVGMRAMGITGFTLATMYRWIRSDAGRAATMHPYMHGHYPGSGSGPSVILEAGLDGDSQYRRIVEFAGAAVRRSS